MPLSVFSHWKGAELFISRVLDGLTCDCLNDCNNGSTTCQPKPGGVCYAQYFSDMSSRFWHYRKGCFDERLKLCDYTASKSHINKCCNDTDKCNANLIKVG